MLTKEAFFMVFLIFIAFTWKCFHFRIDLSLGSFFEGAFSDLYFPFLTTKVNFHLFKISFSQVPIAISYPLTLFITLNYVVANYQHFCTSRSMYLSGQQTISFPRSTTKVSVCVDDILDINIFGLLLSKTFQWFHQYTSCK